MKRKDAIAAIEYAGYHGDDATAIRIYTEHRSISYAAFMTARQAGHGRKLKGVRCACHACMKAAKKAEAAE